MNVSKNHVVCARCHFVGLASGIDWIDWSSGVSGSASRALCRRTSRYNVRSADRSRPSAAGCEALSNTRPPIWFPLRRFCQRRRFSSVAVIEIAPAQMAFEARRAERLSGGALDQFGGGQQRAFAVHMIAEPVEQ